MSTNQKRNCGRLRTTVLLPLATQTFATSLLTPFHLPVLPTSASFVRVPALPLSSIALALRSVCVLSSCLECFLTFSGTTTKALGCESDRFTRDPEVLDMLSRSCGMVACCGRGFNLTRLQADGLALWECLARKISAEKVEASRSVPSCSHTSC